MADANLAHKFWPSKHQFGLPAKITKIIGEKIGYNQRLSIEIDYVAMPVPADNSLTARQCVDKINDVLQSRKINFEPSSDRVDLTGQKILDDIAKILFNPKVHNIEK